MATANISSNRTRDPSLPRPARKFLHTFLIYNITEVKLPNLYFTSKTVYRIDPNVDCGILCLHSETSRVVAFSNKIFGKTF